MIAPTSQDFGELVKNLTVYSGGVPRTREMIFAALEAMTRRMTNVLGHQSTGTAPGGEDNSESASALSWELPAAVNATL